MGAMSTPTSASLEAVARAYLSALERDAPFSELAQFFTADCIQEEFPNRLIPTGERRDISDMAAAAERGRNAVQSQRFEVLHVVADGNSVALEVRWTAILLVPLGSLNPGDAVRARFAMFLRFRGSHIERQNNYDCFDPF